MSNILNHIEEANKQAYTQYGDRLQNNGFFFLQTNKSDIKILRTYPAINWHTQV